MGNGRAQYTTRPFRSSVWRCAARPVIFRGAASKWSGSQHILSPAETPARQGRPLDGLMMKTFSKGRILEVVGSRFGGSTIVGLKKMEVFVTKHEHILTVFWYPKIDPAGRFGSEKVTGVEHNLKETRAGGQARVLGNREIGWSSFPHLQVDGMETFGDFLTA